MRLALAQVILSAGILSQGKECACHLVMAVVEETVIISSQLRNATMPVLLLGVSIKHLLGITDQHYALIIIPLFITQIPACFDTYVSSSGSVLYPCELLKV
jgi:hypothetical protein